MSSDKEGFLRACHDSERLSVYWQFRTGRASGTSGTPARLGESCHYRLLAEPEHAAQFAGAGAAVADQFQATLPAGDHAVLSGQPLQVVGV